MISLKFSSIFSLQNILGQYAEWCESLPLVTSAHNGGFLILEVKVNESHIIYTENPNTIFSNILRYIDLNLCPAQLTR